MLDPDPAETVPVISNVYVFIMPGDDLAAILAFAKAPIFQ